MHRVYNDLRKEEKSKLELETKTCGKLFHLRTKLTAEVQETYTIRHINGNNICFKIRSYVVIEKVQWLFPESVLQS